MRGLMLLTSLIDSVTIATFALPHTQEPAMKPFHSVDSVVGVSCITLSFKLVSESDSELPAKVTSARLWANEQENDGARGVYWQTINSVNKNYVPGDTNGERC